MAPAVVSEVTAAPAAEVATMALEVEASEVVAALFGVLEAVVESRILDSLFIF
ncbi:unnamed protein product [Cuscuta europaea]|uniref:Uncharacterized protein n=1 Tax=Cuscuta europaea TaxID=41803 RepID=A0A9P0Z7P9_CUSEU|nr:unnamed protein product [Cuscuta europaea]